MRSILYVPCSYLCLCFPSHCCWYQIFATVMTSVFPRKRWKKLLTKSIIPPSLTMPPFSPVPSSLPLIEINLWVLRFTALLCLYLQPSLCGIPSFCLGHSDLLPSSCLYVHKHLFLVSFPVFFRLQHKLPSWSFAADSNGSLKHTAASLVWKEPASHPNTNLLPWVLTHIPIMDQFQPTPLSEILKIYHFLSRWCRLQVKLSFAPDLTTFVL